MVLAEEERGLMVDVVERLLDVLLDVRLLVDSGILAGGGWEGYLVVCVAGMLESCFGKFDDGFDACDLILQLTYWLQRQIFVQKIINQNWLDGAMGLQFVAIAVLKP